MARRKHTQQVENLPAREDTDTEEAELSEESKLALAQQHGEYLRAEQVGRNQSRLERLAQIADSSEEYRGSAKEGATPELDLESARATHGDEEEEETLSGLPQPGEDTEEEEEEAEEASIEAATEQAPKKFRIRVDGEDIELSEAELIARASKVAAADKYLEEAKRTRDQVSPAAAAPSAQDVQQALDNERRALVRAIQVGTEEEALAAIARLQQQLSVSPDVVARQIDERMEFRKAADAFQTEYKDIFERRELLDYVLYKDHELVQAGDKRPYLERYKEIGDQVRKMIAPAQAEASRQEKLSRKASSPSVPRAAAARAAAPPEDEDKEESPSEVIAKMAKARGQIVRSH